MNMLANSQAKSGRISAMSEMETRLHRELPLCNLYSKWRDTSKPSTSQVSSMCSYATAFQRWYSFRDDIVLERQKKNIFFQRSSHSTFVSQRDRPRVVSRSPLELRMASRGTRLSKVQSGPGASLLNSTARRRQELTNKTENNFPRPQREHLAFLRDSCLLVEVMIIN